MAALQAEEAPESGCPGIQAMSAVRASTACRGALGFSDTEVTSESTVS